MSAADVFADIASGRRPADDRLLGNCRLEWAGGDVYGEEAILKSFRAAPLLGDGMVIETARSAAWIGDGAALIADLYDGRIGRLWRVGAGEAPALEPAIAVAFDPDLHQQRGDVLLRAQDHPELDPAALATLAAAGRQLIEPVEGAPLHRARAFAIRAFSAGQKTAALFALYRLGGHDVRTSGFVKAVLLIDADGASRVVIDQEQPQEWTPRL